MRDSQVRDLPRRRMNPRHLEEGTLRVAQIETVAVPLQIGGGVPPQELGFLPVLPPPVQILRPVHGPVADRQEQAQDGNVLAGDLAVDALNIRGILEKSEKRDLVGLAVEPDHSDPRLVGED